MKGIDFSIEGFDRWNDRSARKHSLKTWPEYFRTVLTGEKGFELRENDRDFRVGDFLELREWDPALKIYTGNVIVVLVTYLIQGEFGLKENYCAMAIKVCQITLQATEINQNNLCRSVQSDINKLLYGER